MYGATDMNRLRTTSSPSAGAGISVAASWKTDSCGSPAAGREASLISLLVYGIVRHANSLDLHAVVVVDRAVAHVGVALLGGGVDVRAAADVLEPVALGGGDHARAHAVVDQHRRGELPAGVEHPR